MECVTRYSTSSVRSFCEGRCPRLHNHFLEESSIFREDSRAEESLGDYHGDGESFVGYHGDQQFIPKGNHQPDWHLGENKQEMGVVRTMGENYFLSVDISGFEPHEVVVLAYNQCVVVQAEKTEVDGRVLDNFTQKSLLPSDMDPLSVNASLSDNTLTVRVRRVSNKPLEISML